MSGNKVTIFGGGKVGMSAAYAMLLRNTTRNLVLYGRDKDKMHGEQLEFQHSLTFLGTTNIKATCSFEDIEGSDVVVFTAGAPQKPGESRLDLMAKNTEIVVSSLPQIMKYAPNCIVIMVTNPVDILTFKANQIVHAQKGRIFGSGTCLDSARFRFYLSEYLNINPKSIHAYILGEHGDSSFPTYSCADIGGLPLMEMPGFSLKKDEKAYIKARDAAYEIIASKGSTYYAIGVVISQLVHAILGNTKRVFPVSTMLTGQYGHKNVSISVPCVIGKNGVEQILEIPLSADEKKQMMRSVDILKNKTILGHLKKASA